MASTYINDLYATDQHRYMEKIKDFSKKQFENSLDPYLVPENEWVDDVDVWPATGGVQLYLFLFNWEDWRVYYRNVEGLQEFRGLQLLQPVIDY